METREIGNSLMKGLPEAKRRAFSRRSVLTLAGTLGAAAPFGIFGAARALTASGVGSLPYIPGELLICRTAANGEELQGPPRQLKLAWNANAACTVAAPVAKERGIFAKHNLDVDFVNFGGTTDQLLEAIATGKADAGLGLALRWLKPLEQGFRCSDHHRCARRLHPAPRLQGREYRQPGVAARQGYRDQRSGEPGEEFLRDLPSQKRHRSGPGHRVAPVPGQSAGACRR